MKPSLIPLPRSITYTPGVSHITARSPVAVRSDPALPEEAYVLTVADDSVEIAASSPAGEFCARQTLAQIVATCKGSCDNLVIEDAPVLSYRSFMVDSCRHFYGVDELKHLIDAAALFKMNKFHWHLTDDQGWRIEIKKYPLLTEVGGRRRNSLFGGVDEGCEHAGYFTQEQIGEIVDYCAVRHIEVVPEIEMPGHFTAALAAYPFLGCTGEEMEPTMREGIFPNVLCVGSDDAISFIRDVLTEVCLLFPGRYIHIGGDEAPRTHWQQCPRCRAKMNALGLSGFDELQGAFIGEIAAFLIEKGKTAITWNESLKGGKLQPGDALVQRWMDRKKLTAGFAARGGKVIESDFYHYYCDYPYGMTPLKKTFRYDPFAETGAASVVGVECNMWTEFVRSFDDLCEKLFPRLTAVAERGWRGCPARDYCDYLSAVEALCPMLADIGILMLPAEKWDPPARRRLGEVWSFFRGSLNRETLQQAFTVTKKEKPQQNDGSRKKDDVPAVK